MYYTDDPIRDYERYSLEQEEKLNRLPRCSECDEPIQEETCYEINDEYICERCMQDHIRHTEDLIET